MIRQLGYMARVVASIKTGGRVPAPRDALPVLATLNLTENCQSRCVMCDYWMESKPNDIDTDRAVSIIEELHSLGVSALRFLGGEPLLRKDLFNILENVRHLSFRRLTLATNGLLLRRVFDEINRSNITNITVSLDGFGEHHDEVRGIPGGFEEVMRGLSLIRGKRIKVGSLVTKHLAEDIDPLLELCRSKGWDFDLVLPSFDLPFAKDPQSIAALAAHWPTTSEAKEILAKVEEQGHISSDLSEAAYHYLVDRVYPQRSCVLGFIQLQVRANGDLLSGCYELHPVGNVLERSVGEIIDSAAYRTRIQRMLEMDCPGCICGWQISYLAERPMGSVSYARRRLAAGAKPIAPTTSNHPCE